MDPEPSSLFLLQNTMLSSTVIIEILVLFLLLLCSAMVSGAEVAFFSLASAELSEASESGSRRRKIVARLLETPKRLLATILVANNFINIAIVLLFDAIGEVFFDGLDTAARIFIEVGIVTSLILIFGEILPKIYASRNRISFSSFMAYPLNVLDKTLRLVTSPMSAFTSYVEEKFGRQKTNISVDHLSQALELASEEDTTKEEQKILQGIVSFGNTDTKQVMRPRIDMFALSDEMSFSQIIPEIIKHGYSRIPVYQDNMDTVTGVLYVKDLLPHIDQKEFDWLDLLRETYFVPENKKLDDLLKEFQEKKIHLAIVVDEYGGTSGLVTLEDIIEEIVGDISDEFDDEDLIYSKLDEHNYVFEGKTSLKDFYRVIKIEDETIFEEAKGESETIAGFVLEISGGFPRRGNKISFKDYTFTVEALDRKRIKQLKVTLPKK
ncbi:gliding motility-associated protein GldE [Sungkyunkwania multivorans]|uniref:Gliding motility-associated protein GldE n=1 Tax=Sungkyunkwania multivorans TaxID=1173618 RepID=A0ABW3D083_9FLAO